MINIAIINSSTVLKDAQIQPVVAALQTQVSRDFAALWGIDAKLNYVGNAHPPAGSWWLVFLDNSDVAGALGYHDVTNEGLPLGKVFAGTDIHYGSSWSITASHELLEMLADPDINLTAYLEWGPHHGVMYAYEVCDAVEDDSLGYDINGIKVSDFVAPAWFETFNSTGPFDFQKKVTAPLQLLPGGYIGVFYVKTGSGWSQLTADVKGSRYEARPRVGSRRERRKTLRDQWVKSTHKFDDNSGQSGKKPVP